MDPVNDEARPGKEEAGRETDENRPTRGIVEASRTNEGDRAKTSQVSRKEGADPKRDSAVDEAGLGRTSTADRIREAGQTIGPKIFETSTSITRPVLERDERRGLVREASAKDDLLSFNLFCIISVCDCILNVCLFF